MTDPRESALTVVRQSLHDHPEILIACQYLGMLKDDALLPIKEGSPVAEQIAEIAPAPIGGPSRYRVRVPVDASTHTYTVPLRPVESMAIRFQGDRIQRENRSPIHPETGRTLFSMWVDGLLDWHPSIMGWSDDDSRVQQFRDIGEYKG